MDILATCPPFKKITNDLDMIVDEFSKQAIEITSNTNQKGCNQKAPIGKMKISAQKTASDEITTEIIREAADIVADGLKKPRNNKCVKA